MKFLSPDSGLMRGWNNLTDGVWINILMLVTSIPLVTVGAALTAGHDAARKTLAGEGHVTTNYFRSFKSNFVKSTVQWLIFGVALAVLSYAWVVLQIVPLLIPKFGFTIVWIMGFEWVWALQARFENSLGGTLAMFFSLHFFKSINNTPALQYFIESDACKTLFCIAVPTQSYTPATI